MKFVLVNGRRPRQQSVCVQCRELIIDGYLREIATRLTYCDHKCYTDHCESTNLPSKVMRVHHSLLFHSWSASEGVRTDELQAWFSTENLVDAPIGRS